MSKAEIEKAIYGKKRSKYGVGPPEERTVDGITFDSKREKDVYLSLKALERAGVLRALERQVAFPLNGVAATTGKNERVCYYVADFVAQDLDGRTVVYDAKGVKTAMYRMKKKWFELQYGLRIVEL